MVHSNIADISKCGPSTIGVNEKIFIPENGSSPFNKRRETKHVDCGRVLREDQEYIRSIAKQRPNLRRSRGVNCKYYKDCSHIRTKVTAQRNFKPLPFGVAYARVVYESFEFIEDELASSYHPQNVFCYSVDEKSPALFNTRIEFLSRCFPNVLVTRTRFQLTSSGKNLNHAHLECLRLLAGIPGWNYVILMQNYDVMMKSVYETVSILEAMDGTNDILVKECEPERWDHSTKWDTRSLGLFRDEGNTTKVIPDTTLNITRGLVQSTLTRDTVDWMLNTVKLTKLINQLNTNKHAVDEILLASLAATAQLEMPGRSSTSCLKANRESDPTPYFTRHVKESADVVVTPRPLFATFALEAKKIKLTRKGHQVSPAISNELHTVVRVLGRFTIWRKRGCLSDVYRHGICIFGIEDLPRISRRHELLANKALPYFDYAIVDCIHELLYNRTHLGQVDHELDLERLKSFSDNAASATKRLHESHKLLGSNITLAEMLYTV